MKLQEMFGLSFCINLDERKDRWLKCQHEFKKINFYPQRYSAIKDDNPSLGCLKSHISILRKAMELNLNVLIFEDDVEFVDYETSIVEKALDELEEIGNWQMLYLGGNILKPFYQVTNHLAKLNHCQSTHAYSVNKKFIPTLLNFLENNTYIVDVLYAEGVIPKTNCYITIPMMAIQRESYSNIEKQIMNYSIPIERYNKYLVKKDKNGNN